MGELAEFYLDTKQLHHVIIIISLTLFNLRFWLKIWRPDKPLNVCATSPTSTTPCCCLPA